MRVAFRESAFSPAHHESLASRYFDDHMYHPCGPRVVSDASERTVTIKVHNVRRSVSRRMTEIAQAPRRRGESGSRAIWKLVCSSQTSQLGAPATAIGMATSAPLPESP